MGLKLDPTHLWGPPNCLFFLPFLFFLFSSFFPPTRWTRFFASVSLRSRFGLGRVGGGLQGPGDLRGIGQQHFRAGGHEGDAQPALLPRGGSSFGFLWVSFAGLFTKNFLELDTLGKLVRGLALGLLELDHASVGTLANMEVPEPTVARLFLLERGWQWIPTFHPVGCCIRSRFGLVQFHSLGVSQGVHGTQALRGSENVPGLSPRWVGLLLRGLALFLVYVWGGGGEPCLGEPCLVNHVGSFLGEPCCWLVVAGFPKGNPNKRHPNGAL